LEEEARRLMESNQKKKEREKTKSLSLFVSVAFVCLWCVEEKKQQQQLMLP